jgi:hypothetical protein
VTQEDAIKLAGTGWWETLTPRQVAEFQLNEERLCMPFGEFHRCVEEALGRPVWTHEFAQPKMLIAELMGERKPPTLADIIELIPAEKRIVIQAQP